MTPETRGFHGTASQSFPDRACWRRHRDDVACGLRESVSKIATSLEGYGFQPAQSQCVGDRLEANLSLGQLQQLGRAAKASREGDTTPGRLTASDFVRVSGQVKDPKVPLEVGKAAAACGILTDPASPL
jgi:hypothetical protein